MIKTKITLGMLAILFATVTLTSCKNNKTKEESAHSTEMKKDNHHSDAEHNHDDGHHDADKSSSHHQRNIAESSQKNTAISPIIDAYIQIKNGLVATDKNATAKGGEALLNAFSKFDMSSLSEEQHKEYMEIYENAKEQAEHIVKSPVDHQREHFEVLSTDVSDLITLLGTDKTLYVAHCPMANGGKGANWLSEVKEIKNPYFGSKMMKCGSVKKQIN